MKVSTPLLRLAALAMALAVPPSAFAQAWPTKPVRLVAAFPPGTPGDVIARLIQPALQAAWNQPVVIESKTGAEATWPPGKSHMPGTATHCSSGPTRSSPSIPICTGSWASI